MRFDSSWPRDPDLDPFRDAVWELSRNGTVEAHLMSRVLPVRRWWAKRELVWYRLVWLDGRRDRSHIDTGGLWSVIQPLKDGRFELLDIRGLVLDARRLTGHERDVLWHRYMD